MKKKSRDKMLFTHWLLNYFIPLGLNTLATWFPGSIGLNKYNIGYRFRQIHNVGIQKKKEWGFIVADIWTCASLKKRDKFALLHFLGPRLTKSCDRSGMIASPPIKHKLTRSLGLNYNWYHALINLNHSHIFKMGRSL